MEDINRLIPSALDILPLSPVLLEDQDGNHALLQEEGLPMAINTYTHISGSSVPAFSRGHSIVDDNVSAPCFNGNENGGEGNKYELGNWLPPGMMTNYHSKKSLDMAIPPIRHMDIRRTIPGNLRPLMTDIPASSMYSVRSGPARSRTVSVSDSPLATSSNASSEVSVNNNGLCLDLSRVEDDIGSERDGRSPASVQGG